MARRALQMGAALCAAALLACGQRGYEPRYAESGLNFQPGYPPGYPSAPLGASPAMVPSSVPTSATSAVTASATDTTPAGAPTTVPASAPPPEPAAPPNEAASHRAPLPTTLAPSAPANTFANLSPKSCRAEVARRGLPVAFDPHDKTGVATPLRLTGPLRGVRFVTHPAPSPYGLIDCRLALALDEFASELAAFGVVEVRVDNVYRKGARIGGRGKPSQHSHALAADITALTRSDGQVVKVEDHWGATIGATACGPEAEISRPTAHSAWLRDLVCSVARKGIFHHLLTPSFDAAHRNHFHFDIQRDRRSLFLR